MFNESSFALNETSVSLSKRSFNDITKQLSFRHVPHKEKNRIAKGGQSQTLDAN